MSADAAFSTRVSPISVTAIVVVRRSGPYWFITPESTVTLRASPRGRSPPAPVGPLRFEWGFPLNKLYFEESSVFEFTIGNFF